ncbi:MAG: hypothetical protein ACI8UO_002638 [Verrucomicrobiales bacterium]|jgi:hypothetical protein
MSSQVDGVSRIVDCMTGLDHEPSEYAASHRRCEVARLKGRFIKGPIPITWMSRALLRKPSALKVAIALFYQRGLCGADKFKVEPARFRELGVNETARHRGLKELERAGLIGVEQRAGQAPIVRMMEVDSID